MHGNTPFGSGRLRHAYQVDLRAHSPLIAGLGVYVKAHVRSTVAWWTARRPREHSGSVDDLRDSVARPGGLLAMLLGHGLVLQPEVVVTRSLAWLCSLPGARSAMNALVTGAGLEPGESPSWYAEVRAASGARTDLECWWGEPPLPRVVIEAKLGALLSAGQIADYIPDLIRRASGHDALMVVLVPTYRRGEASRVLDEALSICGQPPVRAAVWSYDDVLGALTHALPGSGDLEQLRGLVEACEALDVKPFTEEELAAHAEDRRADLVWVMDQATASLFASGERVLPSGSDAGFSWRRYFEITPGGTNIAVGLRASSPGRSEASAWAWLRIHPATPGADTAGAVLRGTFSTARTEPDRSTWLPLDLPAGVAGAAMVARLVEQIGEVISTLREASTSP